MATNRKRKNRGKGAGALERKRRISQRNEEIRDRNRHRVANTDAILMAFILGPHLGKR